MEILVIFTIDLEHSGRTVLSFLKSELKISASSLANLKRDEIGIMVNGSHVTVRYQLKEGDILFIHEKDNPQDTNDAIAPIDIPIQILFENDDIMLINKPPYMPTHPSHGHTDDTLANAIAYIHKKQNLPFVFRPIGRLDRNTSGISLLAKHAIAASYLFFARQKNLIQKKYIALLEGKLEHDGKIHTIDTYMKRQEESIIIRCISDSEEDGAFRAITQWRVLASFENITVVEAIPITGRTHQLRVHFAHIGHPIIGDDVYGHENQYIGRHALHAALLSIPIPYKGEIQNFNAPPPEDMIFVFRQLCNQDLLEIYQQNFI